MAREISDLAEGVGESSSPPRSSFLGGSCGLREEIFNRLVERGYEEAVSSPESFRKKLEAHFSRLPPSYAMDVNVDKVEDVVVHERLLRLAKDAEKRPVYNIRFVESIYTAAEGRSMPYSENSPFESDCDVNCAFRKRIKDSVIDFESCTMLEDLNLNISKDSYNIVRHYHTQTGRQESSPVFVHEIVFSTTDKPKLLSQLSALLSDIGLNIREAHVFSTVDGFSLDVFVVDGWPVEDTEGLYEAMEKALTNHEGSWSAASHHQSVVRRSPTSCRKPGNWEIDRRMLKIGEKIASGSCGDLHRGLYLGEDVAVKIIKPELLNDVQVHEFTQEVAILREVAHKNVVRFVGACTQSPFLCIVTEYMRGGSLYDYLHKNHNVMTLAQILRLAIDVSEGMKYLHEKHIIHRDLKTANLLMDLSNVTKVADFGVARFQNRGGVMTAETGTYRWMAPEVINHLPYDEKADVFSFSIVLWELVTAKVPYDTMTPLQAALGVRQGMRPTIPKEAHPRLRDLMERCWETSPDLRPSFPEIAVELHSLLREVQGTRHPDDSL